MPFRLDFAGSASSARSVRTRTACLVGCTLLIAGWLASACVPGAPSHDWETGPPPPSSWSALEEEVYTSALGEAGAWRVMQEVGPEMSAKAPPVQINLEDTVRGWTRGEWTLTPRALYGIEARVLERRRYRVDALTDVAPLDFALGWERMTSMEIAEELNIRIARRFYRYRWRGAPPLPPEEITRSSANTHLVPANQDIARALMRVRKGDWVRLYGYLVDITYPDGFTARTSMVRTDTGGGACENLWVVEVEVLDGPTLLP